MDGVELELVCLCGFENFERVVVRRGTHDPVVTDFAWRAATAAAIMLPRSARVLLAHPSRLG
jgi:hypothetical protein